MMENPNVGGSSTFRRRNSLPSLRGRLKTRNLGAKSNPYVGWFRYSPPFSSTAGAALLPKTAKNSHLCCHRSPYVGWFRHAPSTQIKRTRSILIDCLEKELPRMLRAVPARDANGILLNLEELLSTHLAGGAPDYYHKKDDSGSSNLLQKISCWIVDAFQDDVDNEFMMHYNNKIWEASLEASHRDGDDDNASKSSYSHDEDSSSHSSLMSSDDDDDDEDSMDNQRRRSSSISSASSSMMVSSQAEAHYAHSLLTSRTRENEFNSTPAAAASGFLGRLDYDITQMDIVRMTRNASRHLDVESILKLPTITYNRPAIPIVQEPPSSSSSSSEETTHKEEWSWMLVQGASNNREEEQEKTSGRRLARQDDPLLKDEVEKDICVICLDHFVQGDRLRVLPCDHSFHVHCIDHWLSGSHSFEECYTAGCPTCKKRPDQHLLLSQSSESTVPSWAFARIGNALARRDSSREMT